MRLGQGAGLLALRESVMYAQRWHRWFAWRPVRCGGCIAWLRTVERRGCEDMGGHWFEYRKTPNVI